MSQIISAVQEKGGACKTTLICSISAWLAKDGAQVLIIDTDMQDGSCHRWAKKEATNESISVVRHDNDETFYDLLEKVEGKFDAILIDTAGYKSALSQYVIQVSDLILIPTKADELSAAGAIRTWKHVKNTVRNVKHQPEARLALCDFDKATKISKGIINVFKQNNIPMIERPIYHRTGFKEMFSSGGLPRGSAYTTLSEFMGNIQTQKLLKFYNKGVM